MKIFERLSKLHGVDIDKIIFEKDEKEKKKLERSLKKETMRVRTNLIYQKMKD